VSCARLALLLQPKASLQLPFGSPCTLPHICVFRYVLRSLLATDGVPPTKLSACSRAASDLIPLICVDSRVDAYTFVSSSYRRLNNLLEARRLKTGNILYRYQTFAPLLPFAPKPYMI